MRLRVRWGMRPGSCGRKRPSGNLSRPISRQDRSLMHCSTMPRPTWLRSEQRTVRRRRLHAARSDSRRSSARSLGRARSISIESPRHRNALWRSAGTQRLLPLNCVRRGRQQHRLAPSEPGLWSDSLTVPTRGSRLWSGANCPRSASLRLWRLSVRRSVQRPSLNSPAVASVLRRVTSPSRSSLIRPRGDLTCS